MNPATSNPFIVPVFEKLISRSEKESLLKQRARVIWFTGLPCSGKTTLAVRLEKELYAMGFACQVLDGDNIRSGINNNLGFSHEDRFENIRRIAEVSKLFVNAGIITINAFVSPTNDIRKLARDIIGEDGFIEVFLNPSLQECERRDVKGMYKKAREGMISDFTGINAPFDIPEHPSLEIHTDIETIDDSIRLILNCIVPHIRFH